MEKNDKKLKLDLDFLEEGAPKKSEKTTIPEKTDHKNLATGNSSISDGTKWTLGAIGVAVLIIVVAATSSGGDDLAPTYTPPQVNTEILNNFPDASEPETNSYVPVVEREEITPVAQTPLEICQERNGYNATYDSATNSCGCASGYTLGATSNQRVSLTTARDQSCSAKFPGTSWLKNDPTDGHSICDCVAGSYWNNERTACYTLTAYTQSCVNSFGTGAVSTTENNKRVCDCGYGYDFNPSRTMCVTTASINAICERDVGRNSRYSGSSTDGKYNCTEPY